MTLHLTQYSSQELLLFLREELEPFQLEQWQTHYTVCESCRRYIDHSEESNVLLEDALKAEDQHLFWRSLEKPVLSSSEVWEKLQRTLNAERILLRLRKGLYIFSEEPLTSRAAGVAQEVYSQVLLPRDFVNGENVSLIFEHDPLNHSLQVGLEGGSAKTRLFLRMIVFYNDGSIEPFEGKDIAIGSMWYISPVKAKKVCQIDLIYKGNS